MVSRKISDDTTQSVVTRSNVEAFFEHLRRGSLPSLSRTNALQERVRLEDTAAQRQWVILGDVDAYIDGLLSKSMLRVVEASSACFR